MTLREEAIVKLNETSMSLRKQQEQFDVQHFFLPLACFFSDAVDLFPHQKHHLIITVGHDSSWTDPKIR